MENSEKENLEARIGEQRTIGTYSFDLEKRCFVSDTPVELHISKVSENLYRPFLYYIDGYEVGVPDENPTRYSGDEAEAMRQAIDDFNSETFEGHAIVFDNITCEISETP